MNKTPIYITICDIQARLDKFYSEKGRCCTFTEALEYLYHSGQYSLLPLEKPDYEKWDASDPQMLWDIFSTSQLNVHSILRSPNIFASFVSEDYIGFELRDIIPNLLVRHELAFVHAHDYFELDYVLEGSLNIQLNSDHKTMMPGDFCIISSQTEHLISASDDAVVVVIALRKSTFNDAFFNIFRNEDILSDFFHNCLYSSRYSYLLFNIPPDRKICEIIKNIFLESYSNRRCSNEIACSYLSIFFGMILRTYSNTYLQHSNDHSVISQMSAILTYLKANYKTLTLEKLADFFGYDTCYLGKQIHRTTGHYYNEIVTKLKIDEACTMLQYSDKKIDEISQLVGYHSIQHFSRTFRNQKGISPTDFRKKCRQKSLY